MEPTVPSPVKSSPKEDQPQSSVQASPQPTRELPVKDDKSPLGPTPPPIANEVPNVEAPAIPKPSTPVGVHVSISHDVRIPMLQGHFEYWSNAQPTGCDVPLFH